MNTAKPCTPNDMKALRSAGLLKENEIAYIIDQTVIAESIIDGSKRKVETGAIMLESKRQLLNG